MKFFTYVLFLLLFFSDSSVLWAQSTRVKISNKANLKLLMEHFQENAREFDPLSIRILIKKIAKNQLNYRLWSDIRRYLMNNPQVGYDLIYKWERIRPLNPKVSDDENFINQSFENADNLSIREKFNEAFKIYQTIALFLKNEIKKGKRENLFLYTVAVQSMGRALFGAGRLQDALEVYSWIPKNYPRFRQVMFEKMWTGFKAGRLDIALGAIASQESSYFSNFLEPETYLIKAYIFKKLCRDDDLKDLRKDIFALRNKIEKSERKFYRDWLKSDIEILSLSNLTRYDPKDDTSSEVTVSDRESEIKTIKIILHKKFKYDSERLKRDLATVLAYSNIALGSKDFTFVKHEDIDHTKLMENGSEIWAVNDAEDWVDEIGGHVFIGDSLCVAKTTPAEKQ